MSELSVLINQIAKGEVDEKNQASKEIDKLVNLDSFYATLVSELENPDSRGRFWCMDLLIKKASHHFADSKNIIPVLIKRLTDDDHPVVDRAIWALSITGPNSINFIINAIDNATDTKAKAIYIRALGKNTNVYIQAERVIKLFSNLLSEHDAEIRFNAMIAFMDLSPLRPWFDKRITGIDFEPVYREVSKAANEFKSGVGNYEEFYVEWATRYLDLIDRRIVDKD